MSAQEFVPADFEARKGFTFTVLDPVGGDVIGCVHLYPPEREGFWERPDRYGR